MPEIQRFQPKGMPPNENRFTHVVKVGPWVHVAGQTAADENGQVVGKGDPAAQTHQVFKNLQTAVESVGGKLSDFVQITTYVVGREAAAGVREARQGKFGDTPPANTFIIVSGLANPDYLVEIQGVAYVE